MMYVYRLAADQAPWDFAVEFDFSAAMVDAIKTHVPGRQRKWVPELKQWWFRSEVIGGVCALATLHCGGYKHVTPTHREPVNAYATLHLLPTAPPAVVKVVYKTLAKMEHPDKGGDKAKMQRINSAYKELTHR